MAADKGTNISNEAATYMMGHSREEAQRLDSQHLFLRHIHDGNLLNPLLHKAIRDGKIKKVLDIGTGTGIWPYEAAAEMHSIGAPGPLSFVGTDVAKNEHWRRHSIAVDSKDHEQGYAGVSFKLVDLNDDVGMMALKDEYGPFDLVHSRLLFSSIKKGKWEAYVSRVFNLLRPGGYIQLVEHDTTETVTCLSNNVERKDMQIIAAEGLFVSYVIYRGLGLENEIARRLGDIQRRAGFSKVYDQITYAASCCRQSDGSIIVDNIVTDWAINAFVAMRDLFFKFRSAPNWAALLMDLPPRIAEHAPGGDVTLMMNDDATYDDFQRRNELMLRTEPLYDVAFRSVIGQRPE